MKTENTHGFDEIRAARKRSRGLFWGVGVFSAFANLLMLTGPLYMLLVYDRVLSSRSEATLVGLTLLVVFLYGVMGILDLVRGRVMGRIAARFQHSLDARVFGAVLRHGAQFPGAAPSNGLRNLESIKGALASPGLMAMFDLPWAPIFVGAIFVFHSWLGFLALAGGAALVMVTLLSGMLGRGPVEKAQMATFIAERQAAQLRDEAELIQSLGMQGNAFQRWITRRNEALETGLKSTDITGGFSSVTKTFRLFLQSAMLGLGAYLVLQNEMTPGAMIAGSILLGRGLQPIEQVIGQWPVLQRGRKGWSELGELLSQIPPERERTQLPTPKAALDVQQLTVIPPGETQAALRMVSFSLKPGQACGVIGPSGAGKSSLARALTHVWRPAAGKVRLDGAALDNYDPEVLGQLIGYLPQRVTLFDGTIAENIARLSPQPDPTKVHKAAKMAAAHDMILKLPDGYDTRVAAVGGRLSGGQIQRIGLARALYGDPALIVLDEPNSNLDNEGNAALNAAIRDVKADNRTVLIMAHRPAAIQECDMLLMLEDGTRKAFGPKEEVLRQVVQNHSQIKHASAQNQAGGVS